MSHGNIIDITGETFGRLTVLRLVETGQPEARWECACLCGGTTIVRGWNLRSGNTQSCGCLTVEVATNRGYTERPALKHGHTPGGKPSPTYMSWLAMRRRVNNPNETNYHNYGGRGITIDPRWQPKGTGFPAFLADMGERPEGTSLDRIDVDGDYTPSNTRWATAKVQANNRRPT